MKLCSGFGRAMVVVALGILAVSPRLRAQADASAYAYATLAGQVGVRDTADGVGASAQFGGDLEGVAVDAAGNLYVADGDGSYYRVRKVTPSGQVTTLAGSSTATGYVDAVGTAARFTTLTGIAVDQKGNVYVAELLRNDLRKIAPDGTVTTFAGLNGASGSSDGTGQDARFDGPTDLAIDGAGNLYVADLHNHAIRKVTPEGVVTTLAGSRAHSGVADGTGADAQFSSPTAIAVDASDNVYVGDRGGFDVRKITPGGVVTTLAGNSSTTGTTDGTGTTALFIDPEGLAADAQGDLYLADSGAHTIRKITPAGVVTTVGGLGGQPGAVDASGTTARFQNPDGIAIDANGYLYITDAGNDIIRKGTPPKSAPAVTWPASAQTTGVVDPGVVLTDTLLPAQSSTAGKFTYYPAAGTVVGATGITVAATFTPDDTNRYLPATTHQQFVAARGGGRVFEFSHVLGTAGNPGSYDGVGAAATFSQPQSAVADKAGNVYVADALNHTIRKISPTGSVSTFAGIAGVIGASDGTGMSASFQRPDALAIDPNGTLYVTDTGNCTIRKITSDGVVTTFAGKAGETGAIDGAATAARFTLPTALTIDAAGNLYVVDNYAVRKIAADGTVSTLAGSVMVSGAVDASGTAARFKTMTGLTIDSSGNLFVSDAPNGAIRKITPAGVVQTVAGVLGQPGFLYIGGLNYGSLNFTYPTGLVIDGQGRLLVSDLGKLVIVASPVSATLIAGGFGNVDGVAGSAQVGEAFGMSLDPSGNVWFVEENTVRRLTPDGTVTTIAGSAVTDKWNDTPFAGLARDSSGNIYFSRRLTICRLAPSGTVDIVAGHENQGLPLDNTFAFENLAGLAATSTGALLILDGTAIRKLDGGLVTFAGGSTAGNVDAKGRLARFGSLVGCVLDQVGNLYVTDCEYNNVRKITPDGVVSTVAGVPSQYAGSSVDGPAGMARFNVPQGIAIDRAGNLYVADSYNYTIRKIATDGTVSTLAGVAGRSGRVDGKGSAALFFRPSALTSDAFDNLYLTDGGSIREITPDGTVTTVGGITGTIGNSDGIGVAARFNTPTGLLVDGSGNLLVLDSYNASLVKGVPLIVPKIAWEPASMAAGDPLSAAQLDANADVAGSFAYAPALGQVPGFGAHLLTVTFTPDDSAHYVPATVQTTVANFDGAFFGSFSSGSGHWALKIGRDRQGTFIAYLPERHSAIVAQISVDASGALQVSGTEIVPLAIQRPLDVFTTESGTTAPRPLTAASFTLTASIAANGSVTGQLAGLTLSLNGAVDAAASTTKPALYVAPALGASGGSSYVIVGPSGQAVVVTASATSVDGAVGMIDANGTLTTTTAGGAQLALTVSSDGQSLSASIIAAGSSTPIVYSGVGDTVVPRKTLVNLSTRALGSTGDNVTIGGFGIAGSGQKKFLIRAVGPTLTSQGILPAEVMLDPTIELHDALNNNAIVATNDNWGDNADPAAITTASALVGAAAFTSADTKSSALLVPLSPGVYSFVVQGKASTSGVVLLEVYDAETSNTSSSLVNISARARATTGSGVTIGGFAVNGNAPKKLLVRGVGPTLVPQGIPAGAVLQDPVIEVHDALHNNAIVATNDNWTDNTNSSDITVTGARVGATPFLSTDQTSSALLLTLPPGVYTFVASGKNGTSGIVLIEVYDAD